MINSNTLETVLHHLDAVLKRRMIEGLGPGLSLALTARKGLLGTRTYGVANENTREPVTDRTLFQIGSITKHFTAIACLRLVQQGLLDANAPVTDILDWFEVQSDFDVPITFHHLLTHTAGLVMMMDSFPSSWWQTWALRDTSLGFEPGSRFSYSNVGYNVLQCVIQTITGKSFADSLHELIFSPLGMTESYGEVSSALYPRMAQGHKVSAYDDRPASRSDRQHVVNWYELSAGCASVVTTASDLSIFLRMLLNEGRDGSGMQFLSPETFSLMVHPHAVMEGFFEGTTQGYGVMIEQSADTDNQRRIIGGGENLGFEAAMYGDFETGIGVVLFVNSFDVAWKETRWIMDVLRAAANGEVLPDWPHPSPQPSSHLGVRASEYVGTYKGSRGSFDIAEADGVLHLSANGVCGSLESQYGDNFSTDHPDFCHAMLSFGRDASGRVVEAFQLGDWYYTPWYDGPAFFDYPPEWDTYVGHYRSFGILVTNFKIFIRKGALMMQAHSGYVDYELTQLEDVVFRSGSEASPERLVFDCFAGGKALRCILSGCGFYRVE